MRRCRVQSDNGIWIFEMFRRIAKSPVRGDRTRVDENFLLPLCGFRFPIPQPTADAVGDLLPLLPQLFTGALKN